MSRRISIFFRTMVVAAVLLLTPPASGETVTEFNHDSRTVVALRVDPAALQMLLPPAWEVDPAPSGPLKGANILLVFINPWLTQDAEGKPTSVPIERRLLVVIPAKNQDTGEATILVPRSYDANAHGLPGPYKSSVGASFHLEQTLKGDGIEPASGSDLWQVRSRDGLIELRLQYRRGVAVRQKQETRPRSAVDPTILRIYRADQGVDLVRAVPLGIDRMQAYSLQVTVPELRTLFDGSEQLVAIALHPWYHRQVSLP
jgi:hypothetical protein